MKNHPLTFNYDKHGHQYASYRRTDSRIAKYVVAALSGAISVLNVGAGAGSYEPEDKYIVAVEPSEVMRNQRHTHGKPPALIGTAEQLPFDDDAFDASMAMVTIHHWQDLKKGLKELRRVTRNQIVIMTFDPAALDRCWTAHYFPELIQIEGSRYPSIASITETLGGACEVQAIPIPFDCKDGFQEAFYGRPEAFLEKGVRASQSAWGFLASDVEATYIRRLSEDLESGAWDKAFGKYRKLTTFIGSLRLIIAKP
ncbi:hypothetical protein GCM10011391_06810 [Pullulanibacillus camelliae]|uniref:Methyltransferase type 11 domain-containing protein n=2 Tax=Pullulanibacillus camelliae TaxID=1707096 RepID=A0A8J2YCI8_9BACL|nr:hypothetical protein GCM10011391_06810 [Pullulanibacillus camelliae]